MKKRSVLIIAAIVCIAMTSTLYAGQASVVQLRETVQQEGIPKDEPVSTTGTTYGYRGIFDLNTASSEQVALSEGEWDINDAQMIAWEGSAIQNSGSSSLVVRNSYIRGETSKETAPLDGNPGNLLVAGNIRTTLAMGNSENIYLNSTVVSRNWAALSTDAAVPALEDGQKELSLYAYGSEAITMDGGYGGYSDLFCNLYSYGSHFQAAEIGLISGTYGNVTIGTIEDGERRPEVAAVLTQADTDLRSDKQLGSVIEGGRNALMIHSVNLPPYWEYEGYSQNEIPWRYGWIMARGSVLRTDLSLDKGVVYEPQKQAYIDHSKGSVILIKSTNAEISLNSCEIIPGEGGTGYLIQTVFNNDTMFMNAVPDGTTYPGIMVDMRNMDLKGDIAHEDYQRDLYLVLTATAIEGAMNEYDCAHWNEVGAAEGFTDYCLDDYYSTHHGLQLTLTEGSVWNVTGESTLSRLYISEDSQVKGIIYVDGIQQANAPGMAYEGKVVVMPGSETDSADPGSGANTTNPGSEPETTGSGFEPDPDASAGPEEHVHNWVYNGEEPATCTVDGVVYYICTGCGAEYYEYTDALGHDWWKSTEFSVEPDCENNGLYVYSCGRCGEITDELIPALEHDWVISNYTKYCTEWGAEEYTCSRCGAVYSEPVAPGHRFEIHLHEDDKTTGHYYWCFVCGYSYFEEHVIDYGICTICGYSGPFG